MVGGRLGRGYVAVAVRYVGMVRISDSGVQSAGDRRLLDSLDGGRSFVSLSEKAVFFC